LKVFKKVQRPSGTETTMTQVRYCAVRDVSRNSIKVKSRGKAHPITGNEGPEVE